MKTRSIVIGSLLALCLACNSATEPDAADSGTTDGPDSGGLDADGAGGSGASGSGGQGTTASGGQGGLTEPDPQTEVPVKTPVKGEEVSVETKTPGDTPMLVTEGVRAALIPSGGIFVVAAGQDTSNNEAFVAARLSLDGTVHWQKSIPSAEGATGAVIATDDTYYLAHANKLWAFNPEDGSPTQSAALAPYKRLGGFTVLPNGQVVAVLSEPVTEAGQQGSTALVNGTTLSNYKPFQVPHAYWDYVSGTKRSTDKTSPFSTPRAIVRLSNGHFGIQGGVRGHTYLVHLDDERDQLHHGQSTIDDSYYLSFAGLGRRNDAIVYVTTVDTPNLPDDEKWRVARAKTDLTGDSWSRLLAPLGGNGNAAEGVVVLPSGHILVWEGGGMYILAGETGEATVFQPPGVAISSVLPLSDGFLLVGSQASPPRLTIAKYTL